MLAEDVLTTLAHRLRSAQERSALLAPISASAPIDDAAAYAIADRVHRMRLADGALPVGRKIGFTNRNIWDEYGVRQPIWGWMYEHSVSRASNGRGRSPLGRYVQPKIEPEVVFHFASAPPQGADVAGVLACVDWVAHGFEIVHTHFHDWKFLVADTIADGGLHGALVLGDPVSLSRLGAHPLDALASFEIDLACSGQHRETGCGSNVLDSPAHALAHLVAVLEALPGAAPIATGEIVTTGTLTAAYSIRPGETWSTVLRGIDLPGLVLDLVA